MGEQPRRGVIRLGYLDSIRQGRARVRAIVRMLRTLPMPWLWFELVDDNDETRFEYDLL